MRPLRAVLQALSELPELNVMLFALLLNYPWEFIQAPLFAGMAEAAHWEAVKVCSDRCRAAGGDPDGRRGFSGPLKVSFRRGGQ